MKHFVLWTAGIVAGLWIAKELRDASRRIGLSKATVDLNQGSREDLLRIPGVSESLADRIIDNRPYRHRLDLVARMVVPSGVYQNIRDLVDVSARAAENSVNVAS
jgi:radical SAM superfamily enzyme with C-terminal helix-hairpin-helix motif